MNFYKILHNFDHSIMSNWIVFEENLITLVRKLLIKYSDNLDCRDVSVGPVLSRAATILRLLGNETIQFSIRGKKSEPGLRKQLNIDVKSTTKFNFFL